MKNLIFLFGLILLDCSNGSYVVCAASAQSSEIDTASTSDDEQIKIIQSLFKQLSIMDKSEELLAERTTRENAEYQIYEEQLKKLKAIECIVNILLRNDEEFREYITQEYNELFRTFALESCNIRGALQGRGYGTNPMSRGRGRGRGAAQ